jgi:hypothetical protein
MCNEHPRDDREPIDIVYELPPSAQGTYRYERLDGTTVHGDASGEWTLDEKRGLGGHRLLRFPALDGLRAKGPVAAHPPLRDVLGRWGLTTGDGKVAPTPENLERLAGLLAVGTLRVPVQETYELPQAPDALTALATTHTLGKLAIRMQ